MKILLPERENLTETSGVDPTKFYFTPVASAFFKARFADAIRLLGEPVDHLLDVGCGSGIFLRELSRHCKTLFAVDMHPHLHMTVGKMSAAEDITVSLARVDASALPFASESIDAIVSMSTMEHLHDVQPAAEEFLRVLRPGGIAVIGVPVKNLMTDLMLETAYLFLDGHLEDEHVSTHADVLRAMRSTLQTEEVLHIPRWSPECLRMYTTVRFRKPTTPLSGSRR